jgi:hypothetical protein
MLLQAGTEERREALAGAFHALLHSREHRASSLGCCSMAEEWLRIDITTSDEVRWQDGGQ